MKKPPTPRRQCELALILARNVVAAWDDLPRRAAGLRELAARLEKINLPDTPTRRHADASTFTPETLDAIIAFLEQRSSPRVAQRVTDATLLAQNNKSPNPQISKSPHPQIPMPLTIVCAAMRSAFNIGGVFRTADCLGAAAVFGCEYTAPPTHPAVRRAALGAEQWIPWQAFPSATDAIAFLREKNHAIVALETTDDATPLENFQWPFPCALLLGHERFGLPPGIADAADHRVKITMRGRKNSLNVVSALAIALHAARAQWENRRTEVPTRRHI